MKKVLSILLAGCCVCSLISCGQSAQKDTTKAGTEEAVQSVQVENSVVETIMTRRSIRQYKPQAVEREKMQTIVECGINAPNAMNRQAWEVRVVDNADYINGVTELYKKGQSEGCRRSDFQEYVSQCAYGGVYRS